jgi:uncharacterized membrane protein YkvA (DUF1232 family)
MLKKLKSTVEKIKQEIYVYKLVSEDKRTPKIAKIALGFAIAYTISPIDIIPDFIPVLGYMDDAIVSLALVHVAKKLVPKYIIEDCRKKAVKMRK